MKNACLWDMTHLIRRLALPRSCPCLQKEAVPSVTAAWGCFPAGLLGVFIILVTHRWPSMLFIRSSPSIKKEARCCLCNILSVWQQTHTMLPVCWQLYFTLVQAFITLNRDILGRSGVTVHPMMWSWVQTQSGSSNVMIWKAKITSEQQGTRWLWAERHTKVTFITADLCRGHVTRQDNWSPGLVNNCCDTLHKWNFGRLENGSLKPATKCCGWHRHESSRAGVTLLLTMSVSSWQHHTHLPMVRSSDVSKLGSSQSHSLNFNDFVILWIPKGCGRFLLKCEAITSNYVQWSHKNMDQTVVKVCKPLITPDRHGEQTEYLTSLSHVLYFLSLPQFFVSMSLILPQFSSLHALFFFTYTSITHL